MLRTLAQLARRNFIVVDLRANFMRAEREHLVKMFPGDTNKVAIVAMGKPSAKFVSWVHGRVPGLGPDAWFLPKTTPEPDVAPKTVARSYGRFELPSEEEGFDKIEYAWQPKAACQEHLRQWVLQRKATLVVEGLQPGSWFKQKKEEWIKLRGELRKNHSEFAQRMKDAEEIATELLDAVSAMKIDGVENIHNADGKGTPLYAGFKYEDWVILSWRLELHTLVCAFARDVDDPDRPGMPEDHVLHYFGVYFGGKLDTRKLGCTDIAAAVALLKTPLEIAEVDKVRVLRTALSEDTPLTDFVKGVELWRRDRARRLEAGDESCLLSFPKPASKAPTLAKEAEPKAKEAQPKAPLVKASIAKSPAAKPGLAKAPAAKPALTKSPAGVAPKPALVKSPAAKPALTKTPAAPKPVLAKIVGAKAVGNGLVRPAGPGA